MKVNQSKLNRLIKEAILEQELSKKIQLVKQAKGIGVSAAHFSGLVRFFKTTKRVPK
jgi:hypothetical protein